MSLQTQNRDSKGRFFPAGRMDAEQKNSQRWLEEKNKLARLYVELCEKIGDPDLAKHLDIRQHPETGNWHIGHRTANFFYGFSLGALFGQKEGKDKILAVSSLLIEAWAIEKNISRINDERVKLIQQGNA
jgi:hypothetical protein